MSRNFRKALARDRKKRKDTFEHKVCDACDTFCAWQHTVSRVHAPHAGIPNLIANTLSQAQQWIEGRQRVKLEETRALMEDQMGGTTHLQRNPIHLIHMKITEGYPSLPYPS